MKVKNPVSQNIRIFHKINVRDREVRNKERKLFTRKWVFIWTPPKKQIKSYKKIKQQTKTKLSQAIQTEYRELKTELSLGPSHSPPPSEISPLERKR